MSEFVVHSAPGSPFGRTVMIALEERMTGRSNASC